MLSKRYTLQNKRLWSKKIYFPQMHHLWDDKNWCFYRVWKSTKLQNVRSYCWWRSVSPYLWGWDKNTLSLCSLSTPPLFFEALQNKISPRNSGKTTLGWEATVYSYHQKPAVGRKPHRTALREKFFYMFDVAFPPSGELLLLYFLKVFCRWCEAAGGFICCRARLHCGLTCN